ncbi:hypothetical protein [Chlamydia vaughanii]|uniref:hypothetical protein n=1 Tax=Chlamydia vaughanii TaxID=3112552 RepID=UPI0032B24E4B
MVVHPGSLSPEHSIIASEVSEKRVCFCMTSRQFSWVVAAITLLAGVFLLSLEVGALVFFALPTSAFLSVLTCVAICATLVLLGIAMYQFVAKSLKTAIKDTRFLEEKAQLIKEIVLLRSQIKEKQVESKANAEEVETLKLAQSQKDQEIAKAEKALSEQNARFASVLAGVTNLKQCRDLKKQCDEMKAELDRLKEEKGDGGQAKTETKEQTETKQAGAQQQGK